MANKIYCKVDDLILDDSFVEWVLGIRETNTVKWDTFVDRHPECAKNVALARHILLSVNIKEFRDLNGKQVEDLISNVLAKTNKISAAPEFSLFNITKQYFRYAALALICCTVGVLVYHFYGRPVTTDRVAVVQNFRRIINRGSTNVLIKFSDHSTAVLRPNAALDYPQIFTGHERRVYLRGDAFFEISKNKHKPFYVYSGDMKVRVLGTSFLIREDTLSGQSQVLVSTGRVEISPVSKVKRQIALVLYPNEEGILHVKNHRLEKIRLPKPLLLSKESTDRIFNFSATPFPEVVRQLEEAYHISIHYNRKLMSDCQLTALLADQPLDERLKLICKAVEATYRYENGEVSITGKGCGSNDQL
jgi:transmembrane sensor